jgi:quercetin dioxygenase-like cupin family protein
MTSSISLLQARAEHHAAPATSAPELDAVHLVDALRRHAREPALTKLIDPPSTERSWRRVLSTGQLELWLISWPAGTRTDWHDHGPAVGAFTVVQGRLVEHSWDGALRLRDLGPGDVRTFGADHIHDVRNASTEPALSLHAYAPRLDTMTRYRFLGDRVEVIAVEEAGVAW